MNKSPLPWQRDNFRSDMISTAGGLPLVATFRHPEDLELALKAANACVSLRNLHLAVAALIKCKGRFHTAQNYQKLVEAYNNVKGL